MSETRITVRLNGPYRVQGPVRLVDAEDNDFDLPAEIFILCRCGHSENKPFCDGHHREAGFQAETRAGPAASSLE